MKQGITVLAGFASIFIMLYMDLTGSRTRIRDSAFSVHPHQNARFAQLHTFWGGSAFAMHRVSRPYVRVGHMFVDWYPCLTVGAATAMIPLSQQSQLLNSMCAVNGINSIA